MGDVDYDDPAQELLAVNQMEQFYKNYWGQEKMSRLDALRAAQLWVLSHPDDLRGIVRNVQKIENRKSSPEYWGAFVLSGDWR